MSGIRERLLNYNWFGSFNGPCTSVPLPLCTLVGFPAGQGSTPAICYSRNIEVFGHIVLLPSKIAMSLLAFIMCGSMIWHVKSKYTAVGRKEMVIFFYLYLLNHFVELVLTTGVIRASSVPYPYVAAAHVGLITATSWCLLVNGFICFQMIEDGTRKSVWFVRLSSAVIFCLACFLAIDTFLGLFGIFDRANPLGLWVLYFAFNGAFILLYVALQISLVLNTLDSRWPVGDLLLATTFFIISCFALFVFGTEICMYTAHYIDGFFFGSAFNLLAVLMVYKYWDSITKEDLEFAVSSGSGTWKFSEYRQLFDDDAATSFARSSYSPSVGPVATLPDYGMRFAFSGASSDTVVSAGGHSVFDSPHSQVIANQLASVRQVMGRADAGPAHLTPSSFVDVHLPNRLVHR